MIEDLLYKLMEHFAKDPLYLTLNMILVGIGYCGFKLVQQALPVLFKHIATIEGRFNEINSTIGDIAHDVKQHMSDTRREIEELHYRLERLEEKKHDEI